MNPLVHTQFFLIAKSDLDRRLLNQFKTRQIPKPESQSGLFLSASRLVFFEIFNPKEK